jgi:hypothetical protein
VTAEDLLATVLGGLDEAGIAHMLAGSLASSFHGEPRSTQDIDLVIDPDQSSLQRFLDGLDRARYYVGDGLAALRNRSQFNLIDNATGWKVDLIIRRDRAFSHEELSRRQPVEILGCPAFVATVEDTVLSKLEWAALGGSERQLHDVVAMLRASADGIDDDYLDHWAEELGVEDLLAQTRREASSGA